MRSFIGCLVVTLLATAGCNGGSGNGNPGALAPPSTVTAVATDSRVTVAWSAVAGATSYNLYWATSPGVTKATGNPIAGVGSPYDHTGLANGTTCYYVVTSVRGGAEGPESIEVSATPYPLVPPTGIVATGADREVRIDWQPVHSATGYNLYWSSSPGVTKASGTRVAGVATPHLHAGLTNGTRYHYVLTSLQGAAESAESVEVSAVPLLPLLGAPDPTFGGSGWVTHDDAGGGKGTDYGNDITVDGSGRILVTGSSVTPSNATEMAIWRYNDDGTLDATFDGRGWVVHGGAAGGIGFDEGRAISLDSSGRILVAGHGASISGDTDIVVWRYDAGGSLDATFGSGGVGIYADVAGGTGNDLGWDMTLDPSGRIHVAGSSRAISGSLVMVILRIAPGGGLEATFGAGGAAIHDGGTGGGGDAEARAITLDPSGRIFAAGYRSTLATGADMALWCYDLSGNLDGTFGAGGFVTHDGAAGGSNDDYGEGVAVGGAGRVLVAGRSEDFLQITDMVTWAYDARGVLDPTFGAGGLVVHHDAAGGGQFDLGQDVVLDPIDRAFVTGGSLNPARNLDMVIWCYDPIGVLDSRFGTAGLVVHDNAAGGSGDDIGQAITFDAGGRILVTGSSQGTNADMAIWRFR